MTRSKMLKIVAFGVALVGVIALPAVVAATGAGRPSAAGGAAQATAQPVRADRVEMRDFSFDPGVIRVEPGTTVTWTNTSQTPHNVVANDGSWKSDLLRPGDTYQHTFSTAGVYEYRCTLHAGMVGAVVVGDTTPAPALGPSGQPGPQGGYGAMYQWMEQNAPEMWQWMQQNHPNGMGSGMTQNCSRFDRGAGSGPTSSTPPSSGANGSRSGFGPGGMMGGGGPWR